MASWHKRARLGVALFGVTVAAIVYVAMGERQASAPPPPVARADPKAVVEITSGIVEGITGVEKNFDINFSRVLTYPDGSMRFSEPDILVSKGENRTFRIRAKEALTDKAQSDIQLTGAVRMEDSDGFFLTTESGKFDRTKSIATADGAVTFGRGRMSGSGTGVVYDQANDVLTVASQAQVTTRNEADQPVMQFSSGRATLDRVQHVLTVQDAVRVVREEEVIETDRAIAMLSESDDVIRFLELRGNARVQGAGSGIDAMSANDIDLDYTDDGQRLEAVRLDGMAAVARSGGNGAGEQMLAESIRQQLAEDGSSHLVLERNASVTTMAAPGRGGRTIAADALEIDLASDGALTKAVGRTGVRLDLPAGDGTPARSIHANTLDGSGKAGQGLTNATFTGDVVFTEDESRARGAAPASASRTARAARLEAVLADDAVTAAVFSGDVTFEEPGLKACAAKLEYQPERGALALSGATAAGRPVVAEEQTIIEAATIDVTLDTRRMLARGGVTTEVGAAATRCRPERSRPAAQRGPNRMPGLLRDGDAVTIRAAALDYEGEGGKAVYSGRAAITQTDTSINADTIALDQKSGDLTATGGAIATMILDGGTSTGRAHEIVYVDARRLIRYSAPPAGTVFPPAVPGKPAPARQPQLSGPQGDIQAATRIDVRLAQEGGRVEQIDAFGNVRLRHEDRVATGGEQLTYSAADEKYVMTGGAAAPVVLVADCREMRGKTLTFYRSDATIVIDGKEERRTQNARASGPCTPAPASR